MELIVNVPAMERCMAIKKHFTSVEEDLMAAAESNISMKMFGAALKELNKTEWRKPSVIISRFLCRLILPALQYRLNVSQSLLL